MQRKIPVAHNCCSDPNSCKFGYGKYLMERLTGEVSGFKISSSVKASETNIEMKEVERGMVEEVQEGEEEEKKKGKWGKAAKVSLGLLGGLSLLMGYISAAGMKESEIEVDARKPIDDFFAALNARDIENGRRTLHYPHIQIAGNEVSILNGPESFQIDFASLANEGWTYSTLDSCTMRQNCDEKVHFEIQLSMHQANDSRYATYQALWVVTKKEGAWGIQCRSIFPSGVRS